MRKSFTFPAQRTRGNIKLPPSVSHSSPNLAQSFSFEPLKQLLRQKTGICTGRSMGGHVCSSRRKSTVQDGAHFSHVSRCCKWHEHSFVFLTVCTIVGKIISSKVFFCLFFVSFLTARANTKDLTHLQTILYSKSM